MLFLQNQILSKYIQKYIVFTFACWSYSIKSTIYAAAISSTRSCIVSNKRKPSVTAVVSRHIEHIIAHTISSSRIDYSPVNWVGKRRTCYCCKIISFPNTFKSIQYLHLHVGANPSKSPVVPLPSPEQFLVLLPTRANAELQLQVAITLKAQLLF